MANSNKSKKSTWSIDDKPVKVDKWDGTALKNSLDDAAKKVLVEKMGFVESHKLMDGRLAICTVAVGFAMFALIWDYLKPFPNSRPVLIVCVLSYFFLMAILTLYTSYKEKGIFLVALQKDPAGVDPDNVLTISSYLKKYDDVYQLMVDYENGVKGSSRSGTLKHSVAKYFDENGVLCYNIYKSELKNLIDKLLNKKDD
ncbi:probable signal peptidase complex subunit 2 isoform X1 [Octopus vulgaris]|uniref:Signal peptidase complex subunit 2 n=2 Tax=Octopus TaxID=6643 RepID=A0A6P7SM95_9MOLL|nr:probable signal peptidase complex subunit 2 isoform X1 [Octopus sinensis]CAI9725948.1 probable signal peptidase complex subunit 2 isoform X1 [Octopus vulgaris]